MSRHVQSAPASISVRSLVGRPVRWREIRLGTVADVLLDERAATAVGFEVACADGRHRFLALGACRLGSSIEPASPLVLLEPPALEYYRAHCLSFGDANGDVGDVLLQPDGSHVVSPSAGGEGEDEGALAAAPRTPS
jgi:hypothetical protein